jgi:CRISPR-associated protein Csm1
MLLTSAELHALTYDRDVGTVDTVSYETFLSEWFKPDVATHIRSLSEGMSSVTMTGSTIPRLVTLFNELVIEGVSGTEQTIMPTTIDQTVLEDSVTDGAYRAALKKHIRMMAERTNKLDWTSEDAFYESYHALFKAFTANVGALSDDDTTPVAMYERHKFDTILDNGSDKLHMIDFDLSGMQSFIYEVTEGGEAKKQIAKTVRGRSFYLSLLTDFVGYAFLSMTRLPYEFFVVSAGGKGTVALPSEEGAEQRIKEMADRIESMLFHRHRTSLSIAYTVRTISKDDLHDSGTYHAVDIDRKLSTSKKNKFESVLRDIGQNALERSQERCALCGAPVTGHAGKCEVCADAIGLSNALAHHNALTITHDFRHERKGTDDVAITFGDIGTVRISPATDATPSDLCYHVSINHDRIGDLKHHANVFAHGLTFEEIARTDIGDNKLAVLKMDVDNLGLLFLTGLRTESDTYVKYLTLSRRIDHFFTKRLAGICESETYEGKVYVSYAGGDDVVMVCPARHSLVLLEDIMSSFKAYVGGHENIHLSSGIEIFHPKSPFRYAVRFADDKLDKAKGQEGKNSVSVLKDTLPNSALEEVIGEIGHYTEALRRGLQKSIPRKLYMVLNDAVVKPAPAKAFVRNIPHIAYTLHRNISHALVEEKTRLKNIFVTTDIDDGKIARYHVIFGYVLMMTRTMNNEEENE